MIQLGGSFTTRMFWKKRKKTLRELINELKQINKCFKEEKERYSFENAKK